MKNLVLPVLMAMICNIVSAQVPTITSFAPASGPINAQVIINGNNFSSTSTNNHVYFGATKALVINASSTKLTVKVPLGATHHPISVAVNYMVAYSKLPFIVAYASGGASFDANSFTAAVNIPGSASGAAFDIDNNKKIDLMYSLFADDLINTYENATNGGPITFAPLWDQFGGSINPQNIHYADLNGDGKLDIMVTSYTQNRIYIYTNASDPGFSLFYSPITLVTGSGPRRIGVGDLNGDGKPDIICSNSVSHNVSVFKNTSVDDVISFNTKQDFTTATIPDGIAVGDLTGDGKPDVAVAGGGGYLSVLANSTTTGAITFEPKWDMVTGSIYAMDIGDVDNDGKADLVVSNQGSEVIVLRNTSTTSLSFSGTTLNTTFPNGIILSDLNADGKPDIVTANHSGGVSVAKNNSTPGFINFDAFFTYAAGAGTTNVIAADWDNDGLTDLATFNLLADNISILKNKMPVNTNWPQCPQLLSPANGATNINGGIAQTFTWRKEANATGYRARFIQQNGAYTEINTTDTFYNFTPTAGISYTWNVTPLNMLDPSIVCSNFSFNTCPATPNAITISATGSTTICRTDSVRLRASAATNIQWFFNNTLIAGATSDSLTAKTQGDYSVRVLSGTCYSLPSNVITITSLPTPIKPSISPSNDTAFCQSSSVTFTSSIFSGTTSQWFKTGVAIPGATINTYTANQAGSYYVQLTNTSSGCSNYSDTVEVQILPLPAKPVVTALGVTQFCTGDSVKLRSSSATGNQWYRSGFIIAGATGQEYTAKTSNLYSVRFNNGTCVSEASNEIDVFVVLPPSAPTIISTPASATVCAGDSIFLHSSASTTGQWYKNSIAISGATGINYYAKESGAYTVTAIDLGCVSQQSPPLTTTVRALPAKPVISTNGTSLNTTAGLSSYQWYLNNTIITGATASLLNTTTNGVYKVEVSDANGCKNVSDNFNYITTGLNDVTLQGYSIQLYPNPVIDELTLKVSQGFSSTGAVTVNITDATGRPVKTQSLKNGINTISFRHVAAGSYWILLKNGRTEKAVRIVKVN